MMFDVVIRMILIDAMQKDRPTMKVINILNWAEGFW